MTHFELPYTEWTLAQLRQRAYEEGIDHTGLSKADLIVKLEARDLARLNAPFEV